MYSYCMNRMNAYLSSLEDLWDVAANLGESWERIAHVKRILHPLLYENADVSPSHPDHPGHLYGRASDLEGNIARMYEVVRDRIGNCVEYASFLERLFVRTNSDDDALHYYMVAFIHKYMDYVAQLQA